MRKWISKITIALFALSLIGVTTIAMPASSGQRWKISDIFFHSNNLWRAISPYFAIYGKYVNNYYVQNQIRWFRGRQSYLYELTQNARPYIYYVLQQTKKRGMPAEIALLPMIESNYNPFLYSKCGATGLWQLMPETATGFGLLINWWYDERRDVVASTNVALNYLQYLHDYFHSWLLAVAAYDAGEGTVAAAIRYNRRRGQPTDFWSLPLPYETREYVPKLLALADVIKNHNFYGLHLQPVENHPYFTTVVLKTPMNFKQLLKLSGSSLKSLRLLNPGFCRSTTIPNHTYNLLIPTNKVNELQENLTVLGEQHLMSLLLHHRVHAGDSLSILANRYHTSVTEIREMNKLKGDMIRIGENLLIPEAQATPYTSNNYHISEDNISRPQRVVDNVKSHETIIHIAHRYHVTPQKIYFWNRITKPKELVVRQKLIIWEPSAYKIRYHIVKWGESLSTIAHHYKTTVAKLRHSNHIVGNTIRIGQRLVV
ncbi:lytic transglycosylase [Candidatus Coxiella mudrowiae]|uniref:Transglycosylase, Slt family n=1 Tax=Candidatus Coxiella mudrowiae TaxID=2054173 RepID=A0ABM5UVE2_9COXI|nr:LysM peptidoglycan-binding domain-containing protein [Candidatus Coxiella mudrowiae]AKQ33861.1 Transglycosylase, Slt family [Candidatus Coxiella mudrowiae]